jgi:hypothetical protein
VRVVLAAGLAGLLAAAFVVADDGPSPARAAAGTAGNTEVVIDLSGSVTADTNRPVGTVLRRIADRAGRRGTVGLVVFSDTAYEMLPPGTPAGELRPLIRYFSGQQSGSVSQADVRHPWSSFSGGTMISTGLVLARKALARAGMAGRIVLVSDLADFDSDRTRLRDELVTLAADPAIDVEVIALPGADPGTRRDFARAIGEESVASAPEARPAAAAGGSGGRFPLLLVALAGAVALALGAHEVWAVSLRWREAG